MMKATKTQQATLRLIKGERVVWPHERFVVNAIFASLEYGWIIAKPGHEPAANHGLTSCHVEHYEITSAGEAQLSA